MSADDALLHLSRRVDWRFLLRDPQLGRVALVGAAPATLHQALQHAAREVHRLDAAGPEPHAGQPFDGVVLHAPSPETVRRAARLLKPDGWLYLEAHGPLPHLGRWWATRRFAHDYVKLLQQAGLEQIEAYWQWPNAERCTKVLPLGEPEALLYFLAQEPDPRRARLKLAAGRLLARSRVLPLLAPAFNITARRAPHPQKTQQLMNGTPALHGSQPDNPRDTLTLSWLHGWDALQPHRDAWNALACRSPHHRIFQTFEWNRSWWEAFGAGRELWVLLVHEGETLVAVAPLALARQRVYGLPQRVLEVMGFGVSDYFDFLVEPERPDLLERMLHFIRDSGPAWDMLFIPYLLDESPTFDALPRFFRQRALGVDIRTRYEAPTRCFGIEPQDDQKLPRKKSLKRHFNHFARSGTLEFHNLRAADEIAPYLDTLFRQHIERRALTVDPSRFLDPAHQHFYRVLTREMGPTGWLLFSLVQFDGQPIALHFGFEFQNRLLWYKPTFDVALASQSPGEVLIKYMMEDALARGLAEFDFSIGEEEFKYRFANQTRQTHALRVFRHRLPHALYRTVEGSKERLKRSPRLREAGHKLLRKLEAAQKKLRA